MKNRGNDGLSLVALVITIIVLLILAGVTISMVIGNDGVLTKATEADEKYTKAEIEGAFESLRNSKFMEAYATTADGEDIGTYFNEEVMIPYLKGESEEESKVYIQEASDEFYISATGVENTICKIYIINVSSLYEEDINYGNGSSIDDGDVFTLEVITTSEIVDNEDGTQTETVKSTGQYEFKYYDSDKNEEVLSTITLYATNNS